MIEEDNVLNVEQISKILCIHDTRTIKKYVNLGLLPTVQSDGNNLLFSEQQIAEKFGLKNLAEPFINIERAAEITGLSVLKINNYCHSEKNRCPHFRLENVGGSKILFLESSVRDWFKVRLIYSDNANYLNNYDLFILGLSSVLQINSTEKLFGEREAYIGEQILIHKRSLKDLALELDRTSENIRLVYQKFQRKLRVYCRKLPGIIKERNSLIKEKEDSWFD